MSGLEMVVWGVVAVMLFVGRVPSANLKIRGSPSIRGTVRYSTGMEHTTTPQDTTIVYLDVTLSGDARGEMRTMRIRTRNAERTMAKDPVAYAEARMDLPMGTWIGAADWRDWS